MMRIRDFTPEIRQASLRLLEMWRIISDYLDSYNDQINDVYGGTSQSSCFDVVYSSDYHMTDPITIKLCQLETLHEKEKIAQSFDAMMHSAWDKLTERDRFVLDPYRRESVRGEKRSNTIRHFSVSHNRAYQYREIALRHLWSAVDCDTQKNYRKLNHLIYRWGMIECQNQGRMLQMLTYSNTEEILTELRKTGIPLFDFDKENENGLPCVGIKKDWISYGEGADSECLRISLVSKGRDQKLEKTIEERLTRTNYIFQIFRLRGHGKNPVYQVIYEFPLVRSGIVHSTGRSIGGLQLIA